MDANRLRELIDYDPETGAFAWKPRAWRAGQRCNDDRHPGSVSKQTGYRAIRVDKKLYQAHRLAWLYVYGEWPTHQIDHVNGDKLDNRIANLRDVTDAFNKQNCRLARAHNQTGLLGVRQDKRRGVFFSSIKTNGKVKYLGAFETPSQAHAVYIAAKRSLHAGCTI
jgi:hypothetical protein